VRLPTEGGPEIETPGPRLNVTSRPSRRTADCGEPACVGSRATRTLFPTPGRWNRLLGQFCAMHPDGRLTSRHVAESPSYLVRLLPPGVRTQR
jgi:hypothetical protein